MRSQVFSLEKVITLENMKTAILKVINKPITYRLLKDFPHKREQIYKAVVSDHRPIMTLLSKNNRWYSDPICKIRFFHTNAENSANMYYSLSSRFFRATTRIEPEPDTLEKSKAIMISFNIFGVIRILCCFRLPLMRTPCKEPPE